MTLREHWHTHADDWARFARTRGHDHGHEAVNLPAFVELLPPPGRATLDVGCGEGRVGAELVRLGYDVTGVDSSPRMVELAQERHEAVVADAAALPFESGAFDLAVAYMSLMNMDDPEGAVGEIGRVLEPGGRLCIADTHPFDIGELVGGDYVITGSYLNPAVKVFESDRDGIRMAFRDQPIPLERYSRAFEVAGLALEALREPPVPGRNMPRFLHLRAVKL